MFILVVPDSIKQLMAYSNLEKTSKHPFKYIRTETSTKTDNKNKQRRAHVKHTITSSAFTVSTGGTLETLFLFLPLAGVEEEISSRSPPPLTLLEGEVALLLLELADIAG